MREVKTACPSVVKSGKCCQKREVELEGVALQPIGLENSVHLIAIPHQIGTIILYQPIRRAVDKTRDCSFVKKVRL